MRRALMVVPVALAIAACDREAALSERQEQYTAMAAFIPTPLDEARLRTGAGFAEGKELARQATLNTYSELRTRMLIRTAHLTLRVDTLERAVHRLAGIATTVNAIVASSDEDRSGGARNASIELRVATEHFERTIEGIRRLGTEEALRIESDDVGEEFVDLGARLSNGRRLESRLLALLSSRTGKLEDIVAVERELARVRTEIDGIEGRRRYLESHSALSTITVSLREPLTVVGTAAPGVLQHAVERSWENFVWLVSVLVQSLGVVIPLAIIASLGWSLALRARLRRALPAAGGGRGGPA